MLDASLHHIGSWAQLMENEEPPEREEEEEQKDESQSTGGNTTDEKSSLNPSLCVLVKNLHPRTQIEDVFFHFGGRNNIERMYLISRNNACLLVLTSPTAKKSVMKLHESFMFTKQVKVLSAHAQDVDKYSREADPLPSLRTPFRGQQQEYSRKMDHLNANAPAFIPQHQRSPPHYQGSTSSGSPITMAPGVPGPCGRNSPNMIRPFGHSQLPHSPHQPHHRPHMNRRMHDGKQHSIPFHRWEDQRSRQQDISRRCIPEPSVPKSSTSTNQQFTPVVKKPTKQDLFGAAKPVDTASKLLEVEDKMRREREETAQKAKQHPLEAPKPRFPQTPKIKTGLESSHNDSTEHVDIHQASRSGSKIDPGLKTSTIPSPTRIPFRDYGTVEILKNPNNHKEETLDASPPNDPVQHTATHDVPAWNEKNDSPRLRTFSRSTTASGSKSENLKRMMSKHLGPQRTVEGEQSRSERNEKMDHDHSSKQKVERKPSLNYYSKTYLNQQKTHEPQRKTSKDVVNTENQTEKPRVIEAKKVIPGVKTMNEPKNVNKENKKKATGKDKQPDQPTKRKDPSANRFRLLENIHDNN